MVYSHLVAAWLRYVTTEEDPSTASRDTSGHKQISLCRSASPPSFAANDAKPTHKRSANSVDSTASHGDYTGRSMKMGQANIDGLDEIWLQCIERSHSKTPRLLLHTRGKLLSIGESHGVLVVYIAFEDGEVKPRAERFLISITNSIEMVLRRSVEVRIILLLDGLACPDSAEPGAAAKVKESENLNVSTEAKPNRGLNSSLLVDDERSPSILNQVNDNCCNARERRQEIPMQRIESIIREQRLETTWLQAMEKSTPRSMSRLMPEKNQVLPQDGVGVYSQNQVEPVNVSDLASNHWDDELNGEIKALKVNDGKALQKDKSGKRVDLPPISPSLLHQSGFATNLSKDYQGYESGPGPAGCNLLFCWNTKHPRKGKVNQGIGRGSRKGGRFLCFGECNKSKRSRAER